MNLNNDRADAAAPEHPTSAAVSSPHLPSSVCEVTLVAGCATLVLAAARRVASRQLGRTCVCLTQYARGPQEMFALLAEAGKQYCSTTGAGCSTALTHPPLTEVERHRFVGWRGASATCAPLPDPVISGERCLRVWLCACQMWGMRVCSLSVLLRCVSQIGCYASCRLRQAPPPARNLGLQ